MLLAFALAVLLGPEAVSEDFFPAGRTPGCAAAAMAQQDGTTFLAWATAEEPWPAQGPFSIVVTVLDRNLGELAERRILLKRELRPTCLVAASSGFETVLVWSEPQPGTGQDGLYVARFAAGGPMLEPARPLLFSVPGGTRPAIAWNQHSGMYLLVAGDTFRDVPAGGNSLEFKIDPVRVHDAVASTPRGFAVLGRAVTPASVGCTIGRGCVQVPGWTALLVSQPHWELPAEIARGAADVSPSTIACIGDECVAAWATAAAPEPDFNIFARWLSSSPAITISISREPTPGPPALVSASDGERILAVWESGPHDARKIAGVMLTLAGGDMPFPITEGAGGRRSPSVIGLGRGRFLVAYEILDEATGRSRLGGRIVAVDPPRRRIAH